MKQSRSSRSLWWMLLAPMTGLVFGGASAVVGCSGEPKDKPPGQAGSGGSGGSTDDAGSDGNAPECTKAGDPCANGGVCTGPGQCCPTALACKSVCCASGQVCSFDQCVMPGADCHDSEECGVNEYCEFALGKPNEPADASVGDAAGGSCVGSSLLPKGKCLPKPPLCPEGQPNPGGPCLQKCEIKPANSDFTPIMKHAWGGVIAPPFNTDVLMTPTVIQLDDDDCDGKVTERDRPDIVFATMANGDSHTGTLHAISLGDSGFVDKWVGSDQVDAQIQLAAGDLDGDGKPELVGCSPANVVGPLSTLAFRADGTLLWKTPGTETPCTFPSIADPFQKGTPVVLVGSTMLDGKTGSVVSKLGNAACPSSGLTHFADIDGDGKLDFIDGQEARRADGSVLWSLCSGPDALPGAAWTAVADLDLDGKPEVIAAILGQGLLYVLQYDPNSASGAKIVRAGVPLGTLGGGVLTIADVNGDGYPDVGTAGCTRYVEVDGKKLMDSNVAAADTILWYRTTVENGTPSCVTGSSVFDFNADGKVEVVYADQEQLYIFDGATGTDLIPKTCNTSITGYEYPVVADVDGDAQADLLVVSNAGYQGTPMCNGTQTSGIRVFGSASASWARTRRIWNQHTYHVTNVNEDGTIPIAEATNWLTPGLNNFRQNKQPGYEFAATDAVVDVGFTCPGPDNVVVTVRNIGYAALPAGVGVTLFSGLPGSGKEIGQTTTTRTLYAAEAEVFQWPAAALPLDVISGQTPVHVTLAVALPTMQCRTDNDTSEPVFQRCDVPH